MPIPWLMTPCALSLPCRLIFFPTWAVHCELLFDVLSFRTDWYLNCPLRLLPIFLSSGWGKLDPNAFRSRSKFRFDRFLLSTKFPLKLRLPFRAFNNWRDWAPTLSEKCSLRRVRTILPLRSYTSFLFWDPTFCFRLMVPPKNSALICSNWGSSSVKRTVPCTLLKGAKSDHCTVLLLRKSAAFNLRSSVFCRGNVNAKSSLPGPDNFNWLASKGLCKSTGVGLR